MSAAELKFEDPGVGQPSWLALAQAVFNEQASRWDTGTCGGGLRWQIFTFNAGYDYKNAVSNGGFFQLAARLARYTQNQTYVEWADKTWEWFIGTPLLEIDTWQINDGSSTQKNCSDASQLQWTYNYGVFLAGNAYLYNYVSCLVQYARSHTNELSDWRCKVHGSDRRSSQRHTREVLPSKYGRSHG
jgi:mannan endo-1,6-alpha-mannosidase